MKKNISITVSILFGFSILFSLVLFPVHEVVAQRTNQGNIPGGTTQGNIPSTGKIENPFKLGNTLGELINAVLEKVIMPIGGIVVTLMIIYSGFLFVTAMGSEDKIKKARASLLYSVIGAAILLGALAISYAIQNTLDAFKT